MYRPTSNRPQLSSVPPKAMPRERVSDDLTMKVMPMTISKAVSSEKEARRVLRDARITIASL